MVVDGQAEKDQAMQVRIIRDAYREWAEFREEFPPTDTDVQVVAFRLRAALRHAEIGNWSMACGSLRLASQAIQVVNNR